MLNTAIMANFPIPDSRKQFKKKKKTCLSYIRSVNWSITIIIKKSNQGTCSHNGGNCKDQGKQENILYIYYITYIIVKFEKAETKGHINVLIITVKLCHYTDRD